MFNNFIDYEYQPYHKIYIHEVTNYAIYLGDVSAALDMQFIRNEPIKVVVTAAIGMDQVNYQDNQVNHIIYPLLDSKNQNISKFFNQFYELIEKQIHNGNILVHCAAGISRSATLVISYVMKKKSWNFKQAIKFVRQKRPIVLPNLGFEKQLKQYESSIKRQSFTSQFNRQKPNFHNNQTGKYQIDPYKVDLLPDIKNYGHTAFIKSKVLDRNRNFKSDDIDKETKFTHRKLQIRSNQSVHDSKLLKKKPLFSKIYLKQGNITKVQSARTKILQRSNNMINGSNNLSAYNVYPNNENNPIQLIQNKKVSSLSHRSDRVSQQLQLRRNNSNIKDKRETSILEDMGKIITNKLQMYEKKSKTEKNIRTRGLQRIIHL